MHSDPEMTERPVSPFFVYRGDITGITAPNDLEVELDLGFRMRYTTRIRLLGVDTPDVHGNEDDDDIEKGEMVSTFVMQWVERQDSTFGGKWPYLILPLLDDCGRSEKYVAEVYARGEGDSLNDKILQEFPEVAQ